MNKEEALDEFLKGLRIVLSNATAYPKSHPYYIKSVENFKPKADLLFSFLSPIEINIAPDALFIGERRLDKQAFYIELAQFFHLRKISGFEIRKAVTVGELIEFFSGVSLPKKEIIRNGGVGNILDKNKIPHIAFMELDYSALLKAEGEESKDLWVYLFKEAAQKNDPSKINEIADNFTNIIGTFKAKDLFEDEELRQNIQNFLIHLKDIQGEKFKNCTQDMLRSALKLKDSVTDEKVDKVKGLFKDLKENDFASLLWQEISTNDNFDNLSFRLFSQIAGEKKQAGIANALFEKKPLLELSPKAIKKVRELLTVSGSMYVSDVYRNTLSSFLKDLSLGKGLFFDQDVLKTNYRYIILGLFEEEHEIEVLELILKSISRQVSEVIKIGDFEYLKSLLKVLNKKKIEAPLLNSSFAELENQISEFIESIVWEGKVPPGVESLIDGLERSSKDAYFYFDKMFRENKINPFALKLFFKFFPANLSFFYKKLEEKHSDIEFLERILESLKTLDSPLAWEALKRIYSLANDFVKLEVLKAMQEAKRTDEAFLLSILKKRNISLKREALLVLARYDNSRKRAAEALLLIPNFFGINNKIILENMMIIEEIGLKQASDYLSLLARKKFFWNHNIRKKAEELLDRWNVRKD
jgi:hypothetical protein